METIFRSMFSRSSSTTVDLEDRYSSSEKYISCLEEVKIRQDGMEVVLICCCREDEDGTELPTDSYTREDLMSLRYVVITSSRAEEIELMKSELRVKDYESGEVIMNNSSKCFATTKVIEAQVSRSFEFNKSYKQCFDIMFALTYVLFMNPKWHGNTVDNEDNVQDALRSLGDGWASLFKQSPEALGADEEITLPGVRAMLSLMEEEIEDRFVLPWHF